MEGRRGEGEWVESGVRWQAGVDVGVDGITQALANFIVS